MSEDKVQESAETPEDSSPEETPEVESVNEVSQAPQPTGEENALGSKAQSRIRKLIQEKKELEAKLARQAEADNQAVSSPQPPAPSNEVVEAARRLRTEGNMASQDDLNQLLARIELNRQHDSLSNKYSGDGSLPKYDKSEVEDHMRRKNIGDPEAAFQNLYWDELQDASRKSRSKGKSLSEKPTAAKREEPISAHSLQKKLAGPDGRAYYEKLRQNPEKFDALLKDLTSQAQ